MLLTQPSDDEFFFLFLLRKSESPWKKSTPGNSPTFDILRETSIYLKRDVFAAVADVDAKAPY